MIRILIFTFLAGIPGITGSQAPVQSLQYAGLFDSEEILDLKLSGDINTLIKDRGDDHEFHPMNLSYTDDSGENIQLDVNIRTRGNFRRMRSNCKEPPLTFSFDSASLPENSLFAGQTSLKFVVPCTDVKYVIREYLVYKLYNIVTDYSFKVRMVKMIYNDTSKGESSEPEFGFFIEDEDHLATRIKGIILKRDGLRPENLDKDAFHQMAIFAYMAGNTDWSIQFRHNIKLVYRDETKSIVSIPYDFDLVGIVAAPYARPAQALRMRSVKQRRYRGYCLDDPSFFEPFFQHYISLKDEFFNEVNSLHMLEEDEKEDIVKYLGDFFKTLGDEKEWKKDFLYPCDKNGTGNVVLSGLDKG